MTRDPAAKKNDANGRRASKSAPTSDGDEALFINFVPSIDLRHLPLSGGQQRRNAKLTHILSSAAKVLVRDGHAKLSMRAVAAEAGIGLSSLQHYFDSRDALLLETIRATISSWLIRYEELRRQRDLSGKDILESILEDIVNEATKPEVCGFFLEVWTMARHDAEAGELLAQIYRSYRTMLSELILEINPDLPEAEADAIATMISAQGEGLMVMNYHRGALRQPPTTLQSMMQLLWPLIGRLGLKGMADQAGASIP